MTIINIDELCDITIRNSSSAYYGPHLHHALKCLRAGYEANARSWMDRDVGEQSGDVGDLPMPGTLIDHGDWIEYRDVKSAVSGIGGDGI